MTCLASTAKPGRDGPFPGSAVSAVQAASPAGRLPHFPPGGFSPLSPGEPGSVTARPGVTAKAVVQAWLLQLSSADILLIAGTSSVAHFREHVCGAARTLSGNDLT